MQLLLFHMDRDFLLPAGILLGFQIYFFRAISGFVVHLRKCITSRIQVFTQLGHLYATDEIKALQETFMWSRANEEYCQPTMTFVLLCGF